MKMLPPGAFAELDEELWGASTEASSLEQPPVQDVSIPGVYFLSSSHGDLTADGLNDAIVADDTTFVPGFVAPNVLNVAAHLSSRSHLDGGAGYDTLFLNADYHLRFSASTIQNIEEISLDPDARINIGPGHTYRLTMNDANVSAGQYLIVDGSMSASLDFNGRAETDGGYEVFGGAAENRLFGGAGDDFLYLRLGGGFASGGAGDDLLTGGQGNDTFVGGLGADHLVAGSGADSFVYRDAAESGGASFDTVSGFNFDIDRFDVSVRVAAIAPEVTHGALSTATIDADLATAFGKSELHKHEAAVFVPDSGSLAGDAFLIVNISGRAGYHAGQDLVIELDAPLNLHDLSTTNFD